MNARELEEELLVRCAAAARSPRAHAVDQREANVFRVAGMVLRSRFPLASENLRHVSDRYFASHPAQLLPAAEVVKMGWVFNLPRLKDMLVVKLQRS
jgi:hypothetical protein